MKKISFLFFLFAFAHSIFAPSPAAAAVSEEASPRLTLSASPSSPRPGETVKISAKVTPRFDPDRTGLRWFWRGGAGNIRKASAEEVLYEAQNAPVTLTVTLRDLLRDEDIETAVLSVAPQSYTLEIRSLSSDLTTIRLWDDAAKDVVEKKGRAVNSSVSFEALVAPVPTGAVRWIWTPNEGTAVISEDGNRAIVRRNATGTAVVSLTALDRSGLELGRAETSFDVDISSDALERSFRLTRGRELWDRALALREKGEAEAALVQAGAAAEDLTGGGMKHESLQEELKRFQHARDNYFRALELSSAAASLWRDGNPEEALAKYREAQALHAQPRIVKIIAELENILDRQKKAQAAATAAARDAELLAKGGKLREALAKYEASLRLYPDAEVRAALADVTGRLNALERKTTAAEALRNTALELEAHGDLESAFAKMTESQEMHPLPETATDMARLRTALQERRNRQDRASSLGKDAAALEFRGLEGQGNADLLKQALEIYRQASKEWPDPAFEEASQRVENHIDRVNSQVAQVALLVKEATQLEQEGRMEEAMRRYIRAQNIRRTDDTQARIADLERRMEVRRKRMEEARTLYVQATDLENKGKLDEALAVAQKGVNTFSDNALMLAVQRLQKAVQTRNDKIARASALHDRAEEAQMRGDQERALDLYIESDNVWHTVETARTIQTLRGLVNESTTTAARAEELFKEAVILERDSNLVAAEEKLRSSIALLPTAEAKDLLNKVEKNIAEENWIENLKARPFSLRATPPVPRTGERTVIRVENEAWTDDANVVWRWKLTGSVEGNEAMDGGRAYGFYPAGNHPVTVALSALQAETGRELLTQSLSVTPELWTVTLVADEGTKTAKLWNDSLKSLENVREFVTQTDIEVRATISPLPDGPVSWFWSSDPESAIPASRDYKTTIRRVLPGTSKLNVTARDARGIVLGTAQISLLVSVDKNDVLRDAQRAEAWKEWLKARTLWDEGKYLKAMDMAARASVLDPLAHEIANGSIRMKEDFGKMERAARLFSESAWLLVAGKPEEAGEMAAEAENLWPDTTSGDLMHDIERAGEKIRENAILAERLRSEAEALMESGSRVEALLRLQDSLLLEENDAVSRDVAQLIREIEEEKAKRRDAGELRNRGNILADRRHYTEALELYSRSLRLYPDAWLQAYMDILQEKAAEEKVAREKAAALRKEGDALMEAKKTEEALVKYRESLQVWHSDDLDRRVREEEKRISEATAARLRKEAEALLKGKKTTEALAKYRESLKYAYDEGADVYVKKVDAAEIKKRVEELTAEGDAFMKQKKPQEALERYRLALTKMSKDPALLEKVRKLELILKPAVAEDPVSGDEVPGEISQESPPEEPYDDDEENASVDSRDLVQADALFKEGNALYREKKYREALEKYRGSYALSQSQKLKEFIDRLETTLENAEAANKLVQEGNYFYKTKNYREALNKYRESLTFYKNPEVESFILKVEPLAK